MSIERVTKKNTTGNTGIAPDDVLAFDSGGASEECGAERTPGRAGGALEAAVSAVYGREPAGREVVQRPAGTALDNTPRRGVASFASPSPVSVACPPSRSSVSPSPTDGLLVANSPSPTTDGAYVQQQRTCNSEENMRVTKIVGFGRLRQLLQPRHPYFESRWAEIKWWARYEEAKGECDLVYPRVKAFHRENPYRKHQLSRQCAGRAAKSVFQMVESFRVQGARVIALEATMPRVMSEFLAGRGKRGRQMAWAMNSRFWASMVENDLVGDGHARRSNLHTWKTECPLMPHFHFHELVPNWERVGVRSRDGNVQSRVVDMPGVPCPKCKGVKWVKEGLASWYCVTCFPDPNPVLRQPRVPVFERREWRRNSEGTLMPWSRSELDLVKALWVDVLLKFACRYGIGEAWADDREPISGQGGYKGEVKTRQQKLRRLQKRHGVKGLVRLIRYLARYKVGLVDVHVDFVKLNTTQGKAKFLHKIGYAGRHWCEDYAYYSNQHPTCDGPPAFLEHYDNKARLFGWWRDIRELVVLTKDTERMKLSPYSGKPMKYLGRYYSEDLLGMHDGNLVLVDFIKGEPRERAPTDEDREYLSHVDYSRVFAG